MDTDRQPLAFPAEKDSVSGSGQTNPCSPHSATVNEQMLVFYEQQRRPVYCLYEPTDISLVLGAGRKNKGDLLQAAVTRDSIPVLHRLGGGGTVVLSPGMVVFALVTEVASYFRNQEYAREINSWVKEALSKLGVLELEDKGIADLASGDKKLLGCSLYRRKHLLFYQSSLLVNNDLALFEKYLTFPSRVPDYRGQRTHLDFCTSLNLLGYTLQTGQIIAELERLVLHHLPAFR